MAPRRQRSIGPTLLPPFVSQSMGDRSEDRNSVTREERNPLRYQPRCERKPRRDGNLWQFNPEITLKGVSYFDDGDLHRRPAIVISFTGHSTA
jgi:hypothetical protein